MKQKGFLIQYNKNKIMQAGIKREEVDMRVAQDNMRIN